MHLQKEKASEVTKDKHLGIHTIYYRVIDLILPTFVALVFGDFSTEVGEGETFSCCVHWKYGQETVHEKQCFTFIHSLCIIQSILTVSALPMIIAGRAIFQDRWDEYLISSLWNLQISNSKTEQTSFRVLLTKIITGLCHSLFFSKIKTKICCALHCN